MSTEEKPSTVPASELIEPLGSYIATFRTTTQTGPCDYEVRPVCRVITPDTTIAELIAWYRSSHPTAQLVFEIVEAT